MIFLLFIILSIQFFLFLSHNILIIGLLLVIVEVAFVSNWVLQLSMLVRIHGVFDCLIQFDLRTWFWITWGMCTWVAIRHQPSRIIKKMNTFFSKIGEIFITSSDIIFARIRNIVLASLQPLLILEFFHNLYHCFLAKNILKILYIQK